MPGKQVTSSKIKMVAYRSPTMKVNLKIKDTVKTNLMDIDLCFSPFTVYLLNIFFVWMIPLRCLYKGKRLNFVVILEQFNVNL